MNRRCSHSKDGLCEECKFILEYSLMQLRKMQEESATFRIVTSEGESYEIQAESADEAWSIAEDLENMDDETFMPCDKGVVVVSVTEIEPARRPK